MRLSEYLASLGNTPDEVADSLRKQGVKGLVRSSRNCPVINGIYRACTNIWPGLRIGNGYKLSDGEHWHYSATYNDCQIMDPSLPLPVMDFIGKFDTGDYADLEAKVVREVTTTVWE